MTVDIHYQTLSLPPPYAYAYHLQIALPVSQSGTTMAASIGVDLDWQYTEREELSEEEIWEEGFTLNDDFQWQGGLPLAWEAPLRTLLQQTQWLSAEAAPERDIFVTFTITDGKQTGGTPHNLADWDYLLQEVVQGIYEVSGKELPWRVGYLDVSPSSRTEAFMEAHFAHRRFTATIRDDYQSQTKELPWSALRPLLSTVYVPDYHADRAQPELPKHTGQYIHPGDAWYQLGQAVTNPGKTNAIANLQRAIDKIINGK